MREPVAIVMFTIRNADGSEKQVPVEFSKKELDRFLAQGEGVYKVRWSSLLRLRLGDSI